MVIVCPAMLSWVSGVITNVPTCSGVRIGAKVVVLEGMRRTPFARKGLRGVTRVQPGGRTVGARPGGGSVSTTRSATGPCGRFYAPRMTVDQLAGAGFRSGLAPGLKPSTG